MKISEFNYTYTGEPSEEVLAIFEKKWLEHVYKESRYNQSKTARMLGWSRGTLRTKMKLYFGDQYIGSRT